jgi:hypothetical protein
MTFPAIDKPHDGHKSRQAGVASIRYRVSLAPFYVVSQRACRITAFFSATVGFSARQAVTGDAIALPWPLLVVVEGSGV